MSVSKLNLSPFAKPSPTLAHLNRLIASASGTDKLFMLYAYSSHVILYVLRSKRVATKSRLLLAERIGKLGAIISDARVLYRLFGIFPIISWVQSLNDPATAPKDKRHALIEWLQGWSMLLYYPMEHAYYLAGKGVFPISAANINTLALWSCRFWAAYVALQFAHIKRSYDLLKNSKKALELTSSTKEGQVSDIAAEKTRIAKAEQALWTDLLVQCGYLPLTMHWSLPNGLLPDQVWVGLFGTLSAACGLQGVWRATA
ncbi:hypothetical protein T439DRAFT_329299 [Meredithblackwellia eburnea MCA 4105]